MNDIPLSLFLKLQERAAANSLRKLHQNDNQQVDFSTNDYLGFSKSPGIFNLAHQLVGQKGIRQNGSTGSRLLTGNSNLHEQTEAHISEFHKSESALIFNSGYDANVGFFSSVPQRNDVILYDELCHASIRDGIRLSYAKSFKFNHNDLDDLEKQLQKFKTQNPKPTIYIATESVFSMDGDSPNLEQMAKLCKKHEAYLVVDEAHALGVFGENGEGMIQHLGLENEVFARIMTFGKGLGCHGAAILGPTDLKKYLMNFARSFIYTTALSPHSVATILKAYEHLENEQKTIQKLKSNIVFFNQEKMRLGLKPLFVYSKSAIQCAIIPGNDKVKEIAFSLQQSDFDVRPILSPTVAEGQERLRFCLHSYNSEAEISNVLELLVNFVF